ncbi:hypothetical protein KIH79_11055 [Bifidobacterium sp. 82T10]|uniref:Uncharacterized protein n=1 Tax=Bifidobacterium miconis TaxID=2834435 RepID=A0ABS6WHU1_9BIFI|nr:hypothetical protein [Bifidobacterium miconis]MBW3093447.1 hypothetical protein [Bifidobacterium miconis]
MSGTERHNDQIHTSPRKMLGDPWDCRDDMFRWKCAMLLLGQDTWIERRVETVTFTEQGTTRRNIGFDFLLPKTMRIAWRDTDTGNGLIAVPLTFLGKGDLIHADVTVGGGDPVPLLRLDDNKDIAAAALDYCFDAIEGYERLQELCGTVFQQLHGGNESFHARDAHLGIVCTPVDLKEVNKDRFQRIRNVLKRLNGQHVDDVPSPEDSPQVGDSNGASDGYYQVQRQSIQALLRGLDQFVDEIPAQGSTDALTTYLLLLSSLCENYACVVLIPEEQVGSRCLVKLSFDSSYQESDWDRYMLSSSEQLDLSFQTDAAQSTHIEINPIGDSSIALVEWDLRGERRKRIRSSVAAGRVHISAGKRDLLPALHLHLTLLNKLPTILANCAWSLLLLVGCGTNTFIIGNLEITKSIGDKIGSVTDILALLFTLWVARRINSFNHSVSQDLTRYPNVLISANLLIASVSCLSLGVTAMGIQLPVPTQAVAVICAALSLLVSLPVFHSFFVWRRCRKGVPAYHLDTDEGNVVMEEHRVTFLRDSGTVSLPQYNGGYSDQDAMEDRTRKIIADDGCRRTWKKGIRDFFNRHVFHDHDSVEENPSLYPADRSPYLVMEGTGLSKSSLDAKARFVAVHWN